MADLLRLRLRELHWLSIDRCHAVFEAHEGQRMEEVFNVNRGAPNAQGARPITSVTQEGGLLARFDGSPEEIQRLYPLIVAFCEAAQLGPAA